MKSKNEDVTKYVDLAELFVYGDETGGDSSKKSTYSEIEAPIKDLKAFVLSLDWDISEETMSQFTLEVERLEQQWKSDKVLTNLLKILHALGKYINNKRSKAHPDSIKFLNSAYNNLEKIVLTPNMNPDKRMAIALEEVNRFQEFKKQVDSLTAKGDKRVVEKPIKTTGETASSVIVGQLKTVVFALDGKTDNQKISTISESINTLHRAWGDDRTLMVFLKLLLLLSTYVKEKKHTVHPDTFPLMQSIVIQLEKVAFAPELSFQEKSDLAAQAVKRYQNFQKQLTIATPPPAPAPPQDQPLSERSSANIFEDLFKAKPSSPVDEQLTEIHLAVLVDNYSDVRAASLMQQTHSPTDSDTREIVVGHQPQGETPLPDIDQRLNDFFGAESNQQTEDGQVVLYQEDEMPRSAGESAAENENAESRELIPQKIAGEPLPEINERLNDFFQDDPAVSEEMSNNFNSQAVYYPTDDEYREETGTDHIQQSADPEKLSVSPLIALAAAITIPVDSITMNNFSAEISALKEASQDYPDRIILLRLLESTALYLNKYRNQAQPESLELLHSLCAGIKSNFLLSEAVTNSSRDLFFAQLNNYLDFQNSLYQAPQLDENSVNEISIEKLSVQEEAAEIYHTRTTAVNEVDSSIDNVGANSILESNSPVEEKEKKSLWERIKMLFSSKK